jgi:hypothetical protein
MPRLKEGELRASEKRHVQVLSWLLPLTGMNSKTRQQMIDKEIVKMKLKRTKKTKKSKKSRK